MPETPPTAGQRRRPAAFTAAGLGAAALAAAALFVLLAPIGGPSPFPSQDGPAHVYNARLFLRLLLDRAPEARAFYELHLAPFPNWFSHAALAALLTVLPPTGAERLLLAAYALALPLAFRYALAAARPEAAKLFWVSLPFVYGKGLHEGFYNRSFALVPFFVALGYCVRRRGRLGPLESAVLAVLALWTYFTTASSTVVLVLYAAVLGAGFALEDRRDGAPAPFRSRVPAALALLPSVALMAWFNLDQSPRATGPGPGFGERAAYLGQLYDLVAYDRSEVWLAGAFGVALAGALAWAVVVRLRTDGWSWRDGLLLVAVLLVILYFLVPQVTIPGVRSEPQHFRFSPHVLLAVLLWVMALVPLRVGRGLAAAAVAAAVGLTVLRLPVYASLGALVEEQTALAPTIPRGAVFLSISFDYEGGVVSRPIPDDWIVGPLWHAGARVAAERDLVAVDNYEAATRHFPLRYRAGADANRLLSGPGDSPGCLRLGRFNRQAPAPIESILVFRRALAPANACTRLTLDYIARHYALAARSPGGQAELYGLRSSP